jgi:hypothetical protein
MTKLTTFHWRLPRLVALCIAFFFSADLLADEWKLPDLMQLLSQNKSGQALFVEKKYIGIIDKPLLSSGELSFTAPDRLEKRTLKPRPELLLLEGDKLTVSQFEKRPMSINLTDHPEVAGIVGSIRGTLLGDLTALEKSFQLSLSGTPGQWQLVLTPMQSVVSKTISRILIKGSEADIQNILFEQADGDRSEMQISKMNSP